MSSTHRQASAAHLSRSAANRHAKASQAIAAATNPSDQLRKATDYLRSIARLLPQTHRDQLFRSAARALVEMTAQASKTLTRGGDR
jgi:hypothetical protein